MSAHCPGCGGWVSTISGQGEGYECPGLAIETEAAALASPREAAPDACGHGRHRALCPVCHPREAAPDEGLRHAIARQFTYTGPNDYSTCRAMVDEALAALPSPAQDPVGLDVERHPVRKAVATRLDEASQAAAKSARSVRNGKVTLDADIFDGLLEAALHQAALSA